MTGKLHTAQQNQDFTTLQRELVNYFFTKISSTWGMQKFKQFTGDDVKAMKRDWQPTLMATLGCKLMAGESLESLGRRMRNKIDQVFLAVRQAQNDAPREWDFPDLRKINAYMRDFRAKVTPIDQPKSFNCHAWDCPLPGGHVTGDRHYCRFHIDLHINEFDQITQAIRANLDLIRYTAEVVRLGPVCWDTHRSPCPAEANLTADENKIAKSIEYGKTKVWADYTKRLSNLVNQRVLHIGD